MNAAQLMGKALGHFIKAVPTDCLHIAASGILKSSSRGGQMYMQGKIIISIALGLGMILLLLLRLVVHTTLTPLPALQSAQTLSPFDPTPLGRVVPTNAPPLCPGVAGQPAPNPGPHAFGRITDLVPRIPNDRKPALALKRHDGSYEEVFLTDDLVATYLSNLAPGDCLLSYSPPACLMGHYPGEDPTQHRQCSGDPEAVASPQPENRTPERDAKAYPPPIRLAH